jgi:phosphoserine phosphatase RsbU/P
VSEQVSIEAARSQFHEALLDDDPAVLYDRAPCGYLSTLPDGTITKVNQTFLTLTGLRREELVGRRTFASLLTGGGRIYHETHYAPMLQMQDKVQEIALDLVCAHGRRLPVLVNAVLERDSHGTPTVVRIAVFDATARREYERELLRAKDRAEASEAHARALARTLQATLIPPTPPDIRGLDIAAAYRPAGDGEEVGGDFYDVFQVGVDDWGVVIGDVCGKGVEAAVVTALVRYSLRALAVQHREPSRALEALNEILLSHETDRFCTVLLLRLHRHDGRWTVVLSTGGHPLPLLSRPGQPPVPLGHPGPLVGVVDAAVFADVAVELAPAEAVVLYTDGVSEGRRDGEFFGDERLRASLTAHGGSAAGLVDGLLGDVLDFQRDRPRDDIAVVAFQVPSTAARRKAQSPTE